MVYIPEVHVNDQGVQVRTTVMIAAVPTKCPTVLPREEGEGTEHREGEGWKRNDVVEEGKQMSMTTVSFPGLKTSNRRSSDENTDDTVR